MPETDYKIQLLTEKEQPFSKKAINERKYKQKRNEIDTIVKYNLEHGTKFYTIEQVQQHAAANAKAFNGPITGFTDDSAILYQIRQSQANEASKYGDTKAQDTYVIKPGYAPHSTVALNGNYFIPTPLRSQYMGSDKIWWMRGKQPYNKHADVIIQSPEALKIGTSKIEGGFSRHPDYWQTTGPISTKGSVISKRTSTGFTHTGLDSNTITLSKGRAFKIEPVITDRSTGKTSYKFFKKPSALIETRIPFKMEF